MARPTISLALQGGGALGALTWGVLDRLLEDDGPDIDAISGSSAGAVNAAALGHGLATGGREAARATLDALWTAVAGVAGPLPSPFRDQPPNGLLPNSSRMLLGLTRFYSPYQLNPLDINPLRGIIERQIDFERLRSACPVELYIGATHARSGALRLFRNHELGVEHLMASACLPSLHQAVEIDGESYWDGGYAGNPALYPLVYERHCADILVVLLLPLLRDEVPTSADDIRNRLVEIQFGATFMREMRSLAMARRHARGTRLLRGRLERRLLELRFHLIDTQDLVSQLGSERALDTSLAFLLELKREGRARAHDWLSRHRGDLGVRSSVDIEQLFDRSAHPATAI